MHSTERTTAREQVEAGTPSLLVLFSAPGRSPFHPGQLNVQREGRHLVWECQRVHTELVQSSSFQPRISVGVQTLEPNHLLIQETGP